MAKPAAPSLPETLTLAGTVFGPAPHEFKKNKKGEVELTDANKVVRSTMTEADWLVLRKFAAPAQEALWRDPSIVEAEATAPPTTDAEEGAGGV